MLLYPQLLSGATAQFPLQRTYSVSNVINRQEDGSCYRATSVDPPLLSWELRYEHLTGLEMDALKAFFEAARGRCNTFTFLDPAGNLLAWSEDLSNAVWEKSPLATVVASDNEVGRVSRLMGGGAGTPRISQLLACPARALINLSLMARTDGLGKLRVALSDASGRAESSLMLDDTWRRCSVSHQGSGQSEGKTAELSFDEGMQIDVTQVCVSAQPGPGSYVKSTGLSGVKTLTRFDQDIFTVTATNQNDFSCVVKLRNRLT